MMPIRAEITEDCQLTSCSDKKTRSQWTPEQCRIQNMMLLAGCNLAERLEILLTLPGAEFFLKCHNHPLESLTEAIEHWFSIGDRWMKAFEDAEKNDLSRSTLIPADDNY